MAARTILPGGAPGAIPMGGVGVMDPPAAAESSWFGQSHKSDRTVVERLFEADWKATGMAALAPFLAMIVGAQLVTLTIWALGARSFGSFGDVSHGIPYYLRSTCGFIALAFFGSIRGSASGGGDHVEFVGRLTPVAVALVALALTVWSARRLASGSRMDRIFLAARMTSVLSLVVLIAALFGTLRLHLDGGVVSLHVSAFRSTLVAVVLFAAASLFGTLRDDIDGARWEAVLLSVRGALAGVLTAVTVGGLGLVIAIMISASHNHAGSEASRAIPLMLACLASIGSIAFHVGIGGSLHAVEHGFGGGNGTFSLFDMHGAAKWWLLTLALPVIAAVASSWVILRDDSADERTKFRACYRAALPATVILFVLDVVSRTGFGVKNGHSHAAGHAGPVLWQSLLLTPLWLVALGWVVPRLLAPQMRPSHARGGFQPTTPQICTALAVAIFALGIGAAAFADQAGGSHSNASHAGFNAGYDAQAKADLRNLATAEETYLTDYETYTTDVSALAYEGFKSSQGASDSVVTTYGYTGTDGFCLQSISSSGAVFYYNSTAGGLTSTPCYA